MRLGGHPLIHESYWSGLPIVPVVLCAYLVSGIYVNLLAPLIIVKKTKVIMSATLAGALVSVAANFALIPRFGIYGPPWAALAAYCTMAFTVYFYGRRYFPVPYELGRLGLIFLAALALAAPALAGWGQGWQWTAYRCAALAAYPLALLGAGFFLPEEKAGLSGLFAKAYARVGL